MIFIIVIHVIVCILLISIVLIQSGRGGGLVESFSGMESMFGTKTNTFLTRSTTILSAVFFATCLTLAVIAARQSKSLMELIRPTEEESGVVTEQRLPAGVLPEETKDTQEPQAELPKESPIAETK